MQSNALMISALPFPSFSSLPIPLPPFPPSLTGITHLAPLRKLFWWDRLLKNDVLDEHRTYFGQVETFFCLIFPGFPFYFV